MDNSVEIENKEKEVEEFNKKEKETGKEIKRLIKLRRYNEALQLIEKYPNNAIIQSEKITILIYKGKLEEAKKIGYREEFKDYAPIQTKIRMIEMNESMADSFTTEEKESKKPITEELKFLNRIKTKIYCDKIERTDIDEIENSKDVLRQKTKRESEPKEELEEKTTEIQARFSGQKTKKEYRNITIDNNRKQYTKSRSRTRG